VSCSREEGRGLSSPLLTLDLLFLVPWPRYDMKVLGYNLMQAMRFAVEEINAHSSLLPGVLLGYEIVDICYLSNNVQPVLYFLAQKDYSLPILKDYSHYVPHVVAVIGPDNSESTITVANFLSLFLLPQVRPLGPRRKGWGWGIPVVIQRAPFLSSVRCL
jgi:taste receptor type 1 protein 2